jgi:hypothetical protein
MDLKATFADAVIKKAQELKMNRRLLLITIAGLVENIQYDDIYILKHYWKLIIPPMKKSAEIQSKHLKEKKRSPAEFALKKADANELTRISELYIQGVPILTELVKPNEEVRNYHVVAYEMILKDISTLRKRYMKKTGEKTLVGIVRKLCPELIAQCRELAILFSNDLNLN